MKFEFEYAGNADVPEPLSLQHFPTFVTTGSMFLGKTLGKASSYPELRCIEAMISSEKEHCLSVNILGGHLRTECWCIIGTQLVIEHKCRHTEHFNATADDTVSLWTTGR